MQLPVINGIALAGVRDPFPDIVVLPVPILVIAEVQEAPHEAAFTTVPEHQEVAPEPTVAVDEVRVVINLQHDQFQEAAVTSDPAPVEGAVADTVPEDREVPGAAEASEVPVVPEVPAVLEVPAEVAEADLQAPEVAVEVAAAEETKIQIQ